MSEEPSYEEKVKAYTLSDLEDITHHIDRERFPERYQVVIEEIERRTGIHREQHSDADSRSSEAMKPASLLTLLQDLIAPVPGKRSVGVEYTKPHYLWLLIAIVAILLVFNVVSLIGEESVALRVLRVFSVILQASVIGLCLLKRPAFIFSIKLWASLQVMSVFLILRAFTRMTMDFLIAMIGIPDGLVAFWADTNVYFFITVICFILLGVSYCLVTDYYIKPVFQEAD